MQVLSEGQCIKHEQYGFGIVIYRVFLEARIFEQAGGRATQAEGGATH